MSREILQIFVSHVDIFLAYNERRARNSGSRIFFRAHTLVQMDTVRNLGKGSGTQMVEETESQINLGIFNERARKGDARVWSVVYPDGPCKFSYSCARGVSLVG